MICAEIEPQPLFTEKFLSFYDPNQDFATDEHPALLTWLCEGRSDAEDLVQKVDQGVRVLAKEMAHALLITPDNLENAQGLGLNNEELEIIVAETIFDAKSTVQSIRNAVRLMKQHNPQIAELAESEDPKEIMLHGAMASVLAHRNQKPRENGDEFSEHPRAAVAVIDIATRRAFRQRRLPPEDVAYKNLTAYIAYRHDGALEDMMSSKEGERNRSFLRQGGLNITPLVDYLLLQGLDEDERVAYYVATGLVRLTKTVGLSGRREWNPYIRELSIPAPEAPEDYEGLVTLAKRGEMHHNASLDKKKPPKQRANESGERFTDRKERHMRKEEDYLWADSELRDYLKNPLGFPTLVGAKIKTVRKEDLGNYLKRQDRLPALLTREVLLNAYDESVAA